MMLQTDFELLGLCVFRILCELAFFTTLLCMFFNFSFLFVSSVLCVGG